MAFLVLGQSRRLRLCTIETPLILSDELQGRIISLQRLRKPLRVALLGLKIPVYRALIGDPSCGINVEVMCRSRNMLIFSVEPYIRMRESIVYPRHYLSRFGKVDALTRSAGFPRRHASRGELMLLQVAP